MRYTYLGTKMAAGLWAAVGQSSPMAGLQCDPVKNTRGKCVWGNGAALVVDADGQKYVVVARRLRLNRKLVVSTIETG